MNTTAAVDARNDVWETLKERLGLNDTRTKTAKTSAAGWDSQNLLAPCGDGQRTAHLVGLAGSYLQRGFDVNQVIEHCLMWNERNTPPLDAEKVISTCLSIDSTDARNHPDRHRGQGFLQLQPATPLFDLADARIDSFLRTPPPPMRWVLEGFLPLGIVAAIVSPGGVGKSQLLMQTSYSVATGIMLAGFWPVGEVGTVLMLCAEDSVDEIHRRVHRIHKQLGAAMSADMIKQLADNFLIRSMTGMDVLLTQVSKSNEVSRTRLAEQLLLTAQQAKNLKLIIIDPAARFRGGDENSNLHGTQFVQTLEYLALNTGATVLVAHHVGKGANKSQETTQDASRGASSFTDGIRWQLALTSLTSPTKGYSGLPKGARHLYMEAKLVKTNYTAPQPEVLLIRGEDGYLQATTDPMVATTNLMQAQSNQKALLRIIQKAPQGITRRQLEALHGGVEKNLGISQKGLRDVIEIARFEGLVEGASGKPLRLTAMGIDLIEPSSTGQLATTRHGAAPRGTAARRKKT
jgi:hypothetical protein